MKLQDDIDFTTLNWVKQELDETLRKSHQALEAYVEDPSDTSQMRFCASYLHASDQPGEQLLQLLILDESLAQLRALAV